MEPQWRETKLYPCLGAVGIFCLVYLNFSGHLSFEVPVVLWRLPEMDFVGVNHTRFVLLQVQEEFYVNGWNSYWLMQESVRAPSRRRVAHMLNTGARMGLTVCRTWAFSDGSSPDALQLRPAVFDQRLFKALDYVLVEARKQGIRVILSLVNNLNAYGGKGQYVRWAKEAGIDVSSASNDSFFSHPIIKGYYRAYVKAILSRKNYYSGVKYSDDPTIFAWELINEPRCESTSCASDLQAWITEMAAFVKSLDQKHLVTVGLEGFYGLKSNENHEANPGKWAAKLGSDFVNNSAVKDIDFASVHAYPHSWIPEADLEAKVKYLSRWVDAHISDGENVLKKPVLFTEVGAPVSIERGGVHDRDVILKTVYDKIYESAEKRGAGGGALIWQLLVEGVDEYRDKFSLVASRYPSTYKLILEQSCRLRNASSEAYTRNEMQKKDPCLSHIN